VKAYFGLLKCLEKEKRRKKNRNGEQKENTQIERICSWVIF
jgi:hypothetical protein